MEVSNSGLCRQQLFIEILKDYVENIFSYAFLCGIVFLDHSKVGVVYAIFIWKTMENIDR
jgi:hypothetical protein